MLEEEEPKLVLVVDYVGKQFIGEESARSQDEITLKNPVLFKEGVIQNKDGSIQVQINVAPVLNSFHQDNLVVKWVNIGEVTDDKLKKLYEDTYLKIRAAKSGLVAAKEIPSQLLQAAN